MPRNSAVKSEPPPPPERQYPIRSEGQRQLTLVDGSLRQIALAVGVSPQAVNDWKRGTKAPSARARATLWSVYKIPPSSWAQLPAGVQPPPAVDTPPHAVDTLSDAAAPLPGPSAVTRRTAAPTTLDDCNALLNVLRGQRNKPDLMTAERTRLAGEERQLLALKHRLEREADLLEDRLVREHPAWLRVKREIARVLVAYPEAAKAVAEALQRLDM